MGRVLFFGSIYKWVHKRKKWSINCKVTLNFLFCCNYIPNVRFFHLSPCGNDCFGDHHFH